MKKLILFTLLFSFSLPASSFAANFQGDENVYIDKPVNDDLYLAGNEVRVRADVEGDLFMGGNEVILDGIVSEDVFAAGKNMGLTGEIKGDLRAAGESIKIESIVSDDVMFAGQNLNVEDTSTIGGDFIFAAGQVRLEGSVKGGIKGTAEKIYINSQIEGNVFIYNSGEITFGPKAKIMGNLTYSSLQKAKIPEGVVIGKIVFKEKQMPTQEGFAGIAAGFSIYGLLSALLFGLILIGFARHFGIHNTDRVMHSPLKSMGIGFLVLITAPIATIILMFTLIGIPLSFVLLGLWLIALYVGSILASMLLGRYLIKVDEKSTFLRIFGSFALGALIFTALGLIPFIGWALRFLILLMALGGVFLGNLDRFYELRKKKLV